MKQPIFPAVLMLGLVSQVSQVILLRELLMVFQGNELSIGIILAAWMIWVGLGSFLGAFLSSRLQGLLSFLKISVVGLMILLPATIFLIRNLRGFFDILPGAYLSLFEITLASFLVVAPVSLILGMQFVFLVGLWQRVKAKEDTLVAGKTYLVEAVGNMLGGLFFTFILVRYLNAFQSVVIVLALMFLSFFLLTTKAKERYKFKALKFGVMFSFFLLCLVLIFPYLNDLDSWAYQIQWQNFSPYHNLVSTHQSKHGVISVAEREGQYNFFQSGHLVFSSAGPKATAPGLEDQESVVFAHFCLLQHKNPKKILLIGGGLAGMLGEIAKYPVERVDYIELDEVLTEAAKPYLSKLTLDVLSDPRIRLIHTDGRFFIKAVQGKYDMVIINIPDPATAVLNRYYTKEFFQEVKKVLYPDGVFAFSAVSTPDLRGRAIANRNTTIYHTLRSVFNYAFIAGEHQLFYFASERSQQITFDFLLLKERFNASGVESNHFSLHHLSPLLLDSQLRRVNWIVRNHGRELGSHISGPSPGPFILDPVEIQEKESQKLTPVDSRFFINSDFKPIGYFYTLMFWEQLTRAGGGQTFSRMLDFNFNWLLVFLFLPLPIALLLGIGWQRLKKRLDLRFAVLFAVFTTGLSTMALQIALIFSFQSVYGFVYEMVAVIIAVFMCGLALGAYLSNSYIKDKSNIGILAFVQFIIFLFAGLIGLTLPVIARIVLPALIFLLFITLTFTAGLINGLDFPLATACYLVPGKRVDRTVGIIYAVELLGACLGAILASIVIVPVFGIIASCFLAALMGFLAFLVILIIRSLHA